MNRFLASDTLVLRWILALCWGFAAPTRGSLLDVTFQPGSGANSRTPGSLVHAIFSDADGGYLVAGAFTSFDGINAKHFARLTASGQLDISQIRSFPFSLGQDTQLNSVMRASDGTIYAGGIGEDSPNIRFDNEPVSYTGNAVFIAGPGEGFRSGVFFEAGPVVNVLLEISPGKIVVGGQFKTQTFPPVLPTSYWNLGLIDSATRSFEFFFKPGVGIGEVFAVARQPDGKILIGGDLSGAGLHIIRYDSDGALDQSFQPQAPDFEVKAIAIQSDNRILVGGRFGSQDGGVRSRNHLTRLLPTGALDVSFRVGTGPDHDVNAIAIQPDGKILIAGAFESVAGTPRNHIARLHPDGNLDMDFDVDVNDTIRAIVLDLQGRILIAGGFTFVDGVSRNGVARLVSQSSTNPQATPPFVIRRPADQVVASGQEAVFTVEAGGTPPLSFQWRRNNVNIPGATQSSLTLSGVSFDDAGSYSVEVRNAAGSVSSQSATLTVTQPGGTAPTIVEHPMDRTDESGFTAEFYVNASGTPPLSYQWQRDGADLDGEIGSVLRLEFLSESQAGTYTVRVSNAFGSVVSNPAILTIPPPSRPLENIAWVRGAAGTNYSFGVSVTADASGHAFLLGQFEREVTLDSITLATPSSASFLAKISPAGAFLWAKSLTNAAYDTIRADAAGNLLAAGWFSGSAVFGGSTLSAASFNSGFVAKLDGLGDFVWARQLGGDQTVQSGPAHRLALAGSDIIYAAGAFSGRASFGTSTLISDADGDTYLARLDGNGNALWGRRVQGNEFGRVDIAADASGSVFLTGSFYGSMTLGNQTLTSAGAHDLFVSKWDANGTLSWALRAGGTRNENLASIAVDTSGNALLCGDFAALTGFDPQQPGGTALFGSERLSSAGGSDLFVAKLNAAGQFVWVRRFGGPKDDRAKTMSLSADGNLQAVGSFSDIAALGSIRVNADHGTHLLAKFDAQGDPMEAHQFFADYFGIVELATVGRNSLLLTGTLSGGGSFGPIFAHDSRPVAFVARMGSLDDPPATTNNPAGLRISNAQFVTNGFRFEISGGGGREVVVESSTGLNQWTPLSVVSAGEGPAPVVDSVANIIPIRFYRARIR